MRDDVSVINHEYNLIALKNKFGPNYGEPVKHFDRRHSIVKHHYS